MEGSVLHIETNKRSSYADPVLRAIRAERNSISLPRVMRSEVDFRRGALPGAAGEQEPPPASRPASRPDLSSLRYLIYVGAACAVFWALVAMFAGAVLG